MVRYADDITAAFQYRHAGNCGGAGGYLLVLLRSFVLKGFLFRYDRDWEKSKLKIQCAAADGRSGSRNGLCGISKYLQVFGLDKSTHNCSSYLFLFEY